MMPVLNFPRYDFRIKSSESKFMIFDQLRKKYVQLTDEEWVRQHMVRYLITEKKISRSLIRCESGLMYAKRKKRTDILVYDRNGKPFMVIECKAPNINLSRDVLFQAGTYGKSIRAEYLGVTNGLQHFFWKVNYVSGEIIPQKEIPGFL